MLGLALQKWSVFKKADLNFKLEYMLVIFLIYFNYFEIEYYSFDYFVAMFF